MKKTIITLWSLFLLLNLPLHSQNVESFILNAPEKPFYNVKKIGILDFDCSTNRQMNKVITDYIVAELIDQRRGIHETSKLFSLTSKQGQTHIEGVRTDFYQVMEREQLQKVMKEQRLSLSGTIDEGSAAEVGRLLGLDVIIMGNISYSSVDKRTGTDYPCLKRTVTAKGTMKMVSVKTAQIVGTKSVEVSKYVKKCTDAQSEVPRANVIAESAMKEMASQFVNYFAPSYRLMKYDFEKIKLKEFKQKGKEAMAFVKKGELDRAFPIAYAMFEADSYNPKTAYNLGILYEMVGSNKDAFEYYSMAYEMDYSNKDYSQAVKRAENGIALNQYLNDIGRPVVLHDFSSSDGPAGALADKVETKGSSSDRVEVYELPDKKSEIVARVPGGLEFKIIEESGSFYKILLRGSKTGFVPKSSVK
ncbi:MAG: hypothetical protein B7C24_00280 [Bacteroidetes bacterium 4572_77]|nr:MAG: hypothetical protein B7C24_00280 [Bacteroidetes bacterium 4572_77]